MKRVKCKSGVTGWQCRLRRNYTNFEEFKSYCEIYNIHGRLGFATPEEAWKSNKQIRGSVVPSDLELA
jgi:hypothetical protein